MARCKPADDTTMVDEVDPNVASTMSATSNYEGGEGNQTNPWPPFHDGLVWVSSDTPITMLEEQELRAIEDTGPVLLLYNIVRAGSMNAATWTRTWPS